ncbi:hypothetical protein IB211_01870c [Intestinimonas butyriciproducens]|uniref:Uncharacterized protein n=1 Tax=Intestinimonas butyriciproducens TaxID=1297617 RepID=A0A0S2W4K9_9FIRM|nr:hypothetical protein IB211_01870c [Intestinimonas butyriciproducens]
MLYTVPLSPFLYQRLSFLYFIFSQTYIVAWHSGFLHFRF